MTAATTSTTISSEERAARREARALDDLLRLGADELGELYRRASTPRIGDVDGDLRGRMLVSPRGGEALAAPMRRLAKWRFFPWRGKSFRPRDQAHGEGINRVFSEHSRWFRFETSIGPSRAGDFDALQLDYDLPENPFFIRAIKDEIRTLEPGLWLGQAYVVVRDRPSLALYFALQSR